MLIGDWYSEKSSLQGRTEIASPEMKNQVQNAGGWGRVPAEAPVELLHRPQPDALARPTHAWMDLVR